MSLIPIRVLTFDSPKSTVNEILWDGWETTPELIWWTISFVGLMFLLVWSVKKALPILEEWWRRKIK